MIETWIPISFNTNYSVSSLGRVKRNANSKSVDGKRTYKKERILKPAVQSTGRYYYVQLPCNERYRSYRVHRLVAESFIPNPKNLPVVHHRDYNWRNNAAENLEWCTQKENLLRSRAEGRIYTHPKGKPSPNRQLENDTVLQIRKLYKEGNSCAMVASVYKISPATVHKIVTNRSYKDVM